MKWRDDSTSLQTAGISRAERTPDQVSQLPGTDGRKMSKSYGNTINLSDTEPVVRQKLKTMVTDPARQADGPWESRSLPGFRLSSKCSRAADHRADRSRNAGQRKSAVLTARNWLRISGGNLGAYMGRPGGSPQESVRHQRPRAGRQPKGRHRRQGHVARGYRGDEDLRNDRPDESPVLAQRAVNGKRRRLGTARAGG